MPPESPSVTHESPSHGRWLRTGVFSIAMTLLAATAHLTAGGQLPRAGPTVVAGLLVGCLSYPITRRDRGVSSMVAGTVAAQAVLHVAFAVSMAGLASASVGMRTSGTAGHMVMPSGTSGVSVAQAWTASRLDSPTPLMLAVHAGAAVVLAIGLRYGERALRQLAASLRAFFGVLAAVFTGRLEPSVTGADSPANGLFDLVETAVAVLGSDRWGRAPPVVHAH